MARPKLDIDPLEVERLAMLHCTNVEIASFFGCDEGTIRKRFSDIIAKGKDKGKLTLRRYQFRLAEHNVAMAIWLGKNLLGQRDNNNASEDQELKDRGLELYKKPTNGKSQRLQRFLN